MVLEGTVTNVAAFGAFVDVGVHQDGLVHVSALANRFVSDPREVVKSGQVVRVKVLEADPERKRISLTLRLDDEPASGGRAAGGRTAGDRPAGGRADSRPERPRQAGVASAVDAAVDPAVESTVRKAAVRETGTRPADAGQATAEAGAHAVAGQHRDGRGAPEGRPGQVAPRWRLPRPPFVADSLPLGA